MSTENIEDRDDVAHEDPEPRPPRDLGQRKKAKKRGLLPP